jgi:hypothetical protein
LTLDLEIHQHLGSLKHVINIIMWIRDTGCYNYEDPKEVSIEVQQRLEAKILKTVKLHSPVKPTVLEDTTLVHSP